MSYQKKYKSILGAQGLINAPNYLAEQIVCKRAAAKKITIPDRIWDKKFKEELQYKYWHRAYFGEMIKASEFLKQYDEDCVVLAINSNECKVMLSLHNQKFKRIVWEFQHRKKLSEQTKEYNKLNVVSANTLPRKKIGKKTKLGRLK